MARASERTAAAKTVKFKLTAKSSTGVAVVDGNGAYDFTKDQGKFTLNTAVGQGGEMLLTADALYLAVPPERNNGLKWARLSNEAMKSAAASGNAQVGALDQLRKQIDPRETLDELGLDLPNLKKTGSETIRDEKTTHLAGRVDLSDAAIAKAPADRREGLKAAQTAFGKAGYPIDVWFDKDGRVRRVRYAVPQGTGAEKTTTTITLEFFDFGKATGIAIPTTAEASDGATLLAPPATAGP